MLFKAAEENSFIDGKCERKRVELLENSILVKNSHTYALSHEELSILICQLLVGCKIIFCIELSREKLCKDIGIEDKSFLTMPN